MIVPIILLALWLQAVPPETGPVGQSAAPPNAVMVNSEILATIVQSRSTNTRGYKVAIHSDGGATITISSVASFTHSESSLAETLPKGTVDVTRLRSLLAQIGDVSRLPTGHCPKSVSFGTTTAISYAGKTSGDLQCLREAAQPGASVPMETAQELKQCVQAILGELKVNDRRMAPNP